jgi:hypothetical protein
MKKGLFVLPITNLDEFKLISIVITITLMNLYESLIFPSLIGVAICSKSQQSTCAQGLHIFQRPAHVKEVQPLQDCKEMKLHLH